MWAIDTYIKSVFSPPLVFFFSPLVSILFYSLSSTFSSLVSSLNARRLGGHANPHAPECSRRAMSNRRFSFLFKKIFILHNFLILKNYNL